MWISLRPEVSAPNITDRFQSLSFAPFSRSMSPEGEALTNAGQIRADMQVVAPYTRGVRTYSSTNGKELIAPIAGEQGIKVTAGAWLNRDKDKDSGAVIEKAKTGNEREIAGLIEVAKKNRNVQAVVVGNETLLRGDMDDAELAELIRQVKRQVNVPVTTGEIWNTWLDHPEVAASADFILAHILPYWEDVPADRVVDYTINAYNRLRTAYPGKRIVIGEFGWPSHGFNRGASVPDPIEQAKIIRDFVSRADALGIEYNIIEAFDLPKKQNEGSVGQYWGVFDADRNLKFPLTGPIYEHTYTQTAVLALLLGVLFTLPLLRMRELTVSQGLVLAGTANGVAAWLATVVDYWMNHYVTGGDYVTLALSVVMLVPLVFVLLYRVEEMAAIAFGNGPQRLVESLKPGTPSRFPKVSIHVPAYREPPEMLKETIDALAKLEYPNFEAIIIVNNTPDPAMVEPVREHCAKLGDRFKFINAEKVAGFKAGALRIALEHTAADAEIIGVIDADYVVTPDWLKDLVPVFEDPTVGLVQAPQDHRDAGRSPLHEAMNAEYAGFFDIGMVQRNEDDAIVVHGTMCLIRRAAMLEAGNWSSDTICEDTDLGLSIAENGWKTHYTRKRYGYGLLPDDFEAFKKQRHRWAYGGFQIIKKHWPRFLPGRSRLTTAQKRHFVLGWISWLGSESVGALMAVASLAFVPFVLLLGVSVPAYVLTLPILMTFLVYLMHFVSLYRLRVETTPLRMVGAAVAASAVQYTVAKAVLDGFRYKDLAFARTAKGKNWLAGAARHFPALPEATLGGLLLVAGIALIVLNNLPGVALTKNDWRHIREINLYGIALMVQSLPFMAAALIGWFEGSRFNDFALWRAITARVSAVLPRRVTSDRPPALVD
ncbi:cellulose synthase/poly-beta-1,6-N-acetylglucosamine synthase-like glycosyltransferase/exo-beta-1,3-glucanase (GH17 family) [Xanthobacter agilis]|uniref:Cellulose synthase/poly-beta-1,6-N-acetylglucosamine synthase-like glycosyltransferase/exo-beta-1,3-glucanase (GH17 family) n=2 Tax=Xanthobacter agilis TaxID=47492 RepID=A0ABU0LIV6_XANAG|nr:glycosyltransferase [Xanthobacter agilis]MDQ0507064.1 cellulose synthase/poly-beta-1,6-N-acetylglucosamine synthase-like glycosyltransferase/exo-beta-1,3-glucanase (GH17 family) [Xanthobacter agilis]